MAPDEIAQELELAHSSLATQRSWLTGVSEEDANDQGDRDKTRVGEAHQQVDIKGVAFIGNTETQTNSRMWNVSRYHVEARKHHHSLSKVATRDVLLR